jgi:2-methylcitrate dehydratase PrpD
MKRRKFRKDITEKLTEYVVGLRFNRIPPEVSEKTKHCVLDLLGIMVRARYEAESSEVVISAVRSLGMNSGKCTAVCNTETFASHYAALINATLGHSMDFDDSHLRGSLQPGAVIIPAALALAESAGVDGKTLITGIVAGYDVGCKIGIALNPRAHYDRGFHPAATAGVFAATAAGANILGSNSNILKNAFGINGSQAAGSMQFLENGSWNKRIQVGFAAHNAIYSLAMAKHGVMGAACPLEGDLGFFHAYSDNADPEKVLQGLGQQFEIEQTALKPYPSSRFTHSAIDLIIQLVENENIAPDEIVEISIGLASKGVDIVGLPPERKRRPQSVVDAQFSMHFTCAVAAAYRRLTWADYDKIWDPEIIKLMDRINVVHDPLAEVEYPDKLAVNLTIRARNQIFHRFIDIAKGEPEKPLTWDEVVSKFNELSEVGIDEKRRSQIVDKVTNMDKLRNVKDLMALLRSKRLKTAKKSLNSKDNEHCKARIKENVF